jgi:hypothetical protein
LARLVESAATPDSTSPFFDQREPRPAGEAPRSSADLPIRAVARPPNRSILLARAVGTLNRATGFAAHAPASAQGEINSIELEARNLRAWLSSAAADQTLSDAEARLVVLARRLDDLEDAIRSR